MQFIPHEYQKIAIKHILDHPAAALLLDMGLGKTVITLTAILYLMKMKTIRKVLVIAPLRVAKDTLDERVLRALEQKDRVQEALIEAVRAETGAVSQWLAVIRGG